MRRCDFGNWARGRGKIGGDSHRLQRVRVRESPRESCNSWRRGCCTWVLRNVGIEGHRSCGGLRHRQRLARCEQGSLLLHQPCNAVEQQLLLLQLLLLLLLVQLLLVVELLPLLVELLEWQCRSARRRRARWWWRGH